MGADHHVLTGLLDVLVKYFPLLNGIILAFLWWMNYQFKSIRCDAAKYATETNQHLAKINGHITEELQWRRDHIDLHDKDDDNHEATRKQCRELQYERIQRIATELDAVRRRLEG